MNPDWILALVIECWPSERSPDGGHGLGVPDREIRPERRVPEDTQTDQETEEEQTMSEFSDKYHRSVALTKATEWAAGQITSPRPSAERILEVAEKFRAFLAGETAEEQATDSRPVFKLPHFSDQYIYFQFGKHPILYRSDLGYMSDAPGSVERISAALQRAWKSASERSVNTRQRLRDNPEYHALSAHEASEVLRSHVKDVRFE